MSTRDLDIEKFKEIADELLSKEEYADTGDFADEFSPLILPHLLEYTRKLLKSEGVPDDYYGYAWDLEPYGFMEVLLCHLEGGRYYPSVSSDWWEAKISSVDIDDPDLGTTDPAEAMAWGLADLLCNLFGASVEEVTINH
jgi:hypothetical protein